MKKTGALSSQGYVSLAASGEGPWLLGRSSSGQASLHPISWCWGGKEGAACGSNVTDSGSVN